VDIPTLRFRVDGAELFDIWLKRLKRNKKYDIEHFQSRIDGGEEFCASSASGVGCYFMYVYRDGRGYIESRKDNKFYPDNVIETHIKSLFNGCGE